MARKTFEMSFQIGGKLASSFSNAFSGVNNRLTDLGNQARQTQRALDSLNNDFRRGKIEQEQYEEATKRLTRQLAKLEMAQKGLNDFKSSLAGGAAMAKSAAAMAAVAGAAAATGVAINSLSTAGNFEQQMTKVGVIAGASSRELNELKDTALELGAKSSLSASEVAVAMGEIAAKGMDTNAIVGAMPGIIAAAEASGEDLAMTSEVVTSALNAFAMEASGASHVADVMAMSANKTAAGVEDLGYSFQYAAPVANTLGISLEELAAATGIMADKGLGGQKAGTALRMALIRLSDPPTEAAKALSSLNFEVTDSQGKFKSLTQLSKDWNKATKNLSDTQKVQYASTVFGTEAATGMINLFAAGSDKIDELTKSLEGSTGAAKEAADAMKDNYAGALEELSGSIETAQIKFMTPVLPVFKELFEGVGSILDTNLGGIEQAGGQLADGLRDIFEPFATKRPELTPEIRHDPDAYAQYRKDLSKYMKFEGMDFGDKFVYMLDEAAVKISAWLDGPGGESMNKIFTKLGEIAAKAWFNAFTGLVKSSVSNLAQGNLASGLGLGAAAWTLGGGALVKGGLAVGKMAGGMIGAKGPVQLGSKAAATVAPAAKAVQSGGKAAATAAPRAAQTAGKVASLTSKLGGVGKVLGKAAVPIAAVTTVIDVIRSDDKARAAASGAGGLAAGAGGAKVGAAIGTAIAPGIGTAIGGVLGGIVGYAGGKWLGGKAVDTARQSAQPPGNTKETAAQADDSLNTLKSGTDKLKTNLEALANQAEQAEGWLESLSSIQTAGKQVEQALYNLAMRINNVQMPNMGGNKRVSFFG
ncbi:phage tail tape measure protein [Desulfitobacterium chlororespirans]|uniref:Phage tail tape measure protein, TP901 family, core region n=1 Tax=Desulfitobacterium chlororespirans DSM 11544 TaxID=1121395 RepID=A0A1M7U2S8_9FIRM|nr:phage tail tape measure protein [Desulfitobacterium chlororespirans]SHN77223.1 phage tail tape measure protein, TP901 family, core region [Desulfitobacterium chlororespirans DSM 11544]